MEDYLTNTWNLTKTETVQVVTEKVVTSIPTIIDGWLPNGANISITPASSTVELLIGAKHKDRVACHFGKKSLIALAEQLKQIAAVLED